MQLTAEALLLREHTLGIGELPLRRPREVREPRLWFTPTLTREVAPETVLTRIKDLVGGEFTSPAELFILPELWVSASVVEHPVKQEIYRDLWGVDRRTSIVFGRGYATEPEARRRAADVMSLAAVRLVRALDTDGGMTWEQDPKLLRSEGRMLHLYQWWPQWSDPAVREQVPEPYTLTSDDPSV